MMLVTMAGTMMIVIMVMIIIMVVVIGLQPSRKAKRPCDAKQLQRITWQPAAARYTAKNTRAAGEIATSEAGIPTLN